MEPVNLALNSGRRCSSLSTPLPAHSTEGMHKIKCMHKIKFDGEYADHCTRADADTH